MKRTFCQLAMLAAFILPGMSGLTQIIVTNPSYPTSNDSCTIIYDAALGNAELKNVAPPVYAHTGVITNLSTSGTDWKHVVAGWTENIPKATMTPLGNNKYQLKIKPSVQGYYGVPVSEQIMKMAFVFRNSDGSKVGRNADGSDIFADVYPDSLSVNIVLPASKNLFTKLNDPIPVLAVSPLADSIKILVNGSTVKTISGQQITDTLPAASFGHNWMKQWVKIIAFSSTGSVSDSFSYTVIPSPNVAALPAGVSDGINYPDSQTVILSLYAPLKNDVFVIGDFNDWTRDSAGYMNITPDGNRYWLQIENLVPKQEYIFQYLVNGTLYIGDPYADKVSDPDDQYIPAATYPGLKPYPKGKANGVATFLQPGQDQYPWTGPAFTPPEVTDLVIYELLIRDFLASHDYPALTDTLDYLKRLGVNAIELMPVMEFEGNISWGYNPDYSFALDKYYGTKNGLKKFVEAAHLRGIAVILDIVCNHHFGQSPLVRLYWDANANRPAANNPWFNPVPKHPYNVGFDFNHESPATKTYMERLLKYWLTEYHVDGYRFDLSKGFTQKNSYPDNVSLWGQYDASRVSIITNYANVVHMVKPGAYVILEHLADNSEETALSARNMLLWGNMTGPYQEAAMGYNSPGKSDLSWASYQNRGWAAPNLIAYMESHDEERMMYKNITWGSTAWPYSVNDTGTALKRVELAATFYFTIPGPKMIWQFGELGYDFSINYPTGTGESRLAPKPIRWDYPDDWRRRYTKNIFSVLTGLKTTLPVFSTTDYTMDVGGAIKRIWLNHSTMNATVLGNFDVIAADVVPGFTKTGKWYELFTGDSLNVTDLNASINFMPGEYRLYTTVRMPKPYFTGISGDQAAQKLTTGQVTVYPNPSGRQFNFMVNLPHPSPVSVTVYDLYGRVVRQSALEHAGRGINTLTLDLAPTKSVKLTSGLYFYRLDAGSVHDNGKLILDR